MADSTRDLARHVVTHDTDRTVMTEMPSKTVAVQKSKPTIKEVAKESGVSIATVSAVIHGAAWVSGETRQRVQKTIATLGYRPNNAARMLKTRTSNTVAVVVSDLSDAFGTDVLRHLGRRLRERGRSILLFDSCDDAADGTVSIRAVLDSQADAVVLIGGLVPKDLVVELTRHDVPTPIVSVGHDYGVEGVDTVLADLEVAGFEATMHLVSGGPRRIALIRATAVDPASADHDGDAFTAGYRRALNSSGLAFDGSLVVESDVEGGQLAMRRLLELDERPDAVLAFSTLACLGASQVVLDAGLCIPAEVSFMCVGDVPVAAHAYPPLSTITLPSRELGEGAAELILEPTGSGNSKKPKRLLYAPRLSVRTSCGR